MWTYNGIPFDESMIEKNVGFVYIIKNLVSNRAYIGKKLFQFTRTKKRKGKRNQKIKKSSDWEEYYGSNDELLHDVSVLGSENFTREILKLCPNKGSCNYWEAKYHFQYGVLESDSFYNQWIFCKIHKAHVKV